MAENYSKTPELRLYETLKLIGTAEDSRIIPESDGGGIKDLANIHMLNLMRIAESTKPLKGVKSTSHNFSLNEYNFIVNLFQEFYGLPEKWTYGRVIAYDLMRSPEFRKKSPGLQKMYSGFKDFFKDLGLISKIIILNSIDERFTDSNVISRLDDETQEKLVTYLFNNKNQNWKALHVFARSWGINFPEQYAELKACKPEVYTPKLQKNEHSLKLVKSVIHELVQDEVIDDFEKEVAKAWINKRFEGFDLNTECINKMLEDITRKDFLFYWALNNKLNGITAPPTITKKRIIEGKETEEVIDVKREIADVVYKVERAQGLLQGFRGANIDNETAQLIVYGLGMAGIRGRLNAGAIFDDCGISKESLKQIDIHDVPELKKYAAGDKKRLLNCKITGLEEMAKLNPALVQEDFL